MSDQVKTSVRMAVFAIFLTHTGLLAWGAYRHSPTENEVAHLVAGISHWELGRFELYRVNPPLVKMVAAIPVIFVGAETNWSSFTDSPGSRPVFAMGREFIAANGERSVWLYTIARWACLPFSLVGGYVCYRWASDLYGVGAGLLALSLWCLSPNIIAHGQLITPDIGATSLGIAAAYLFWRWLCYPGWWSALAAGGVLGLAELTKTTWIVLFAIWPMIWLIAALRHRQEFPLGQRLRHAMQLAVILLLALYVLNLGYVFEGSFQRLGDFSFVSKTLKGPDASPTGATNRFADSWLRAIPIPLPKNYVMGIDVQKRDFENMGKPSYLRGEMRDHGWWYYYLYASAVKVPIGTWLLILLAILLPLTSIPESHRHLAVLFIPPVVVFTLVSSQLGFNHHFRYVLPAFPFVIIAIGKVSHSMTFMRSPANWLAAGAVTWSIASSLSIYPHSLSYFNELAGGPLNGPKHLINSNIDWGQDALYLKEWLDKHPEARPINLAYWGHFDPSYAGVNYQLPSTYTAAEIATLNPGWYAISVNFLKGFPWHAPNGKGGREYIPENRFALFDDLTPYDSVANTLYIYRVEVPGTY